jgi:hypothetical protein
MMALDPHSQVIHMYPLRATALDPLPPSCCVGIPGRENSFLHCGEYVVVREHLAIDARMDLRLAPLTLHAKPCLSFNTWSSEWCRMLKSTRRTGCQLIYSPASVLLKRALSTTLREAVPLSWHSPKIWYTQVVLGTAIAIGLRVRPPSVPSLGVADGYKTSFVLAGKNNTVNLFFPLPAESVDGTSHQQSQLTVRVTGLIIVGLTSCTIPAQSPRAVCRFGFESQTCRTLWSDKS